MRVTHRNALLELHKAEEEALARTQGGEPVRNWSEIVCITCLHYDVCFLDCSIYNDTSLSSLGKPA